MRISSQVVSIGKILHVCVLSQLWVGNDGDSDYNDDERDNEGDS